MEEEKEKKEKKNSLLDFICKLWEKEAIRFVVIGGLNTVAGILVTWLIRYLFTTWNWDTELFVVYYRHAEHLIYFRTSTIDTTDTRLLYVDVPYVVNFVLLLPFAYTTQTKFAFRTPWSWGRFARYPISSIPNLVLTSLFICLFAGVIGLSAQLSYVLAPILALPIMFFIIRFLVKPIKKRKSQTPSA